MKGIFTDAESEPEYIPKNNSEMLMLQFAEAQLSAYRMFKKHKAFKEKMKWANWALFVVNGALAGYNFVNHSWMISLSIGSMCVCCYALGSLYSSRP